MKLFTSIAAAAVIGAAGVLATAPAAQAKPAQRCDTSIKGALRAAGQKHSETELPARIICHDFDKAYFGTPRYEDYTEKEELLQASIEKTGAYGFIGPEDVSFYGWNEQAQQQTKPAPTYTAPAPRPVTKPAAPRPVTATNTTTNTNDSALRSGHGNRPSRSTTGSTGSTRNKAEIACPPGQQYAHIKIGGLLFKQTAFKGCGTPSTIAYWEHQKRADMNRRWANFGKGVADAAKAYGDSIQNSLPTYTTCDTRLNGFGGASSTCYSY